MIPSQDSTRTGIYYSHGNVLQINVSNEITSKLSEVQKMSWMKPTNQLARNDSNKTDKSIARNADIVVVRSFQFWHYSNPFLIYSRQIEDSKPDKKVVEEDFLKLGIYLNDLSNKLSEKELDWYPKKYRGGQTTPEAISKVLFAVYKRQKEVGYLQDKFRSKKAA